MQQENTSLIPYENVPSSVLPAQEQAYRPQWSIENAIIEWLAEKMQRTGSERTKGIYEKTVKQFRSALQREGLDFDSVAVQDDKRAMQAARDKVKRLALAFSLYSARGKRVSQATSNNRLAVLSSFYKFCIRNDWLDYNPIARIGRSKIEPYAGVKALDYDEIIDAFSKMDMNKPQDCRDAAILRILLETAHRVTVVSRLTWQNVKVHKGNMVTLDFFHCKGNKAAVVDLSEIASSLLLKWMHTRFSDDEYGRNLLRLSGDTPLFVSLARGCHPDTKVPSYGKRLSIQAIGQICLKHLGTSKVHDMRHTSVKAHMEAGATPQEIQKILLHSSLHTTTLYTTSVQSNQSKYTEKVSKMYGDK